MDVYILNTEGGLTFINPSILLSTQPWIWPTWDDAATDPLLIDLGILEHRPGEYTDEIYEAAVLALAAGEQRLAKHPDATATTLHAHARTLLARDNTPHGAQGQDRAG